MISFVKCYLKSSKHFIHFIVPILLDQLGYFSSGQLFPLYTCSLLVFSTVNVEPALRCILYFHDCVWYLFFQFYYRSTSRELRRLDSVSRSPIYTSFTETMDGSCTIRAFKSEVTVLIVCTHVEIICYSVFFISKL